MKKILVAASLLAALCAPVWAEPAKEQPKVKTLFDYKQELSLSDEQITNMKAQLNELNNS